jgi:hypothetical protein
MKNIRFAHVKQSSTYPLEASYSNRSSKKRHKFPIIILKAVLSALIALAISGFAATYTITWSKEGNEDVSNSFQCTDGKYLLDTAADEGFKWPCSGRIQQRT